MDGLVAVLLLMRSPPDGLDVSSVIDALRDGWDFEVDVAEYAAVGAGSYHWHVADTTGDAVS